jgi:hypothetical protein
MIDSSTEIQLHIDVAVDGHMLVFRRSTPAMALRGYFDQRRKEIKELHPTATWQLDCNDTGNARYEVVKAHCFSGSILTGLSAL